jgi:hypothetical protein
MNAKFLYSRAEALKQRYSKTLDTDRELALQIWDAAKIIEAQARVFEAIEELLALNFDHAEELRDGRPM